MQKRSYHFNAPYLRLRKNADYVGSGIYPSVMLNWSKLKIYIFLNDVLKKVHFKIINFHLPAVLICQETLEVMYSDKRSNPGSTLYLTKQGLIVNF